MRPEIYTALVEKGNDGIVIIQDGRLKFVNPKMLEAGGFSADEVIGRPFLDLVAPEHRSAVAENYRRLMAGEEAPQRYEIGLLTKSGRCLPVEINSSLITYEAVSYTHLRAHET
ncbi:MAG: PAS domain S-box protein, partial [Dehalococcoidia bacterium]|nr:PAS domain S-box protein [Dehalococcoidia bacterium]